MAKRLITPQEIVETTIIGGDVDIDKYNYCIENAQIMTIEPLLGSELYDKIVLDFDADTLSGLYLILYTDYVKPILKFKTASEYIEVCSYSLTNGGLLKTTTTNKEATPIEEVEKLSGKYDSLAQMYIERFNKWIGLNSLDEYKTDQDEVDATDVNIPLGWDFVD